ncbi:FMN-linked oxidoreductase [Aspergillus aculeatinus CBS 121060]|uniref:FMN-linked oxidoreductase n=1 Tax=Aspergillus aculeatinus CBS 121060 TaxID=1448322 RepID=A0ACD1GV17_9EURO|nr:FMN-linked oxidoreductase [Aspergillus aculeatinus CBS 121060]RAH65294.1 FMN-linked oxidoreductase [Aspergillus aculeatinus CBS 121060]
MSQTHRNYQPEIYSQGATSGVTPAVAIDPRQLEEQAKTALGVRSFNYIAGGAREKATMVRQQSAGVSSMNDVRSIPAQLKSRNAEKYRIEVPEMLTQLYWPMDDITTSSLIRVKDNGFSILIITLDTQSLAWRPADLDNAYVPFIKGMRNEIGFTDLLGFLGRNWDGPLLLKGIQHVGDAKLAVEAGCRQVDAAIGSLEVLPEVIDVAGDKPTVLFDSGIRTSADAIKALRLGARQFLLAGQKIVIRGLLADVWQNMGLLGIRSVTERYRDRIRKVVYPGDRHAMM